MSNAHFVQPEMKFVLVAICKILEQNKIKKQNTTIVKPVKSITLTHIYMTSYFPGLKNALQ
jgi:hypothetical protein